MAVLAVQDASAGLAPTFVAATAGGDTVSTDGAGRGAGWDLGLVLLVRNGDVAAKTVTVEGATALIVAAGGEGIIPVPLKHFGAPAAVTYSAVTSVTVAAVKIAGK
jgi:hypothetical protein